MPADQAVPSPVSTSTPTSSRNSSCSSTRNIWRLSFGLMALRFSGRLNLTQAMRSARVNETVSASSRSVLMMVLDGEGGGGSDGKLAGKGLDGDPAQLGELIDARHAAEAAITGSAHAAERHLRLVVHRGAVDVAHSGADLARDAQPARRIAGEDRSREPILAVVGDADGVCLVLGRDDADDRTEALLAV